MIPRANLRALALAEAHHNREIRLRVRLDAMDPVARYKARGRIITTLPPGPVMTGPPFMCRCVAPAVAYTPDGFHEWEGDHEKSAGN